jgi:hypothetical protein
MPSLHKYMLDAFVRCLDDCKNTLYSAMPGYTYIWTVSETGKATAVQPAGDNVLGATGNPVVFTVFGVVRSLVFVDALSLAAAY